MVKGSFPTARSLRVSIGLWDQGLGCRKVSGRAAKGLRASSLGLKSNSLGPKPGHPKLGGALKAFEKLVNKNTRKPNKGKYKMSQSPT